ERGCHHDPPPVDVRREVQRPEGHGATSLDVGRLPDAARVAVTLFALEFERARRIVDPEYESLLLPGLQVRRQLELERDIAPVVEPELPAVEPRRRAPVGGADHEEDAPPPPAGGHLDCSSIPTDVGAVRNARERAPPGKRDDDGARRRQPAAEPLSRLTFILRIELELPEPVQILPLLPLEVGPGVLGQGDRHALGRCPFKSPRPLSPSPFSSSHPLSPSRFGRAGTVAVPPLRP